MRQERVSRTHLAVAVRHEKQGLALNLVQEHCRSFWHAKMHACVRDQLVTLLRQCSFRSIREIPKAARILHQNNIRDAVSGRAGPCSVTARPQKLTLPPRTTALGRNTIKMLQRRTRRYPRARMREKGRRTCWQPQVRRQRQSKPQLEPCMANRFSSCTSWLPTQGITHLATLEAAISPTP